MLISDVYILYNRKPNPCERSKILYYNSKGIRNEQVGSSDSETDKLWIDISDPSPEDLQSISKEYDLDEDSIRLVGQKTKETSNKNA